MEIRESIFWNLIRILWQRKIIFISSILGIAILTFIVTSLIPKTYKANFKFIVNEEENGLNISSLISDIPFDLGGMGTANVDKYLAFLESRQIKDVLIEKFNLWEEYGEDYIEFIYKKLDENIEIIDNRDGTISVNCYFKRYPEKAAQMAQCIYDELYALTVRLNFEKNKNYREYLERNLDDTYTKLYQLEDSLKEYQVENKILKFNEQAEFSFKALAELQAEDFQYQIEYDYMKSSVSENSPALKEMEKKLYAIERKKNKLYKEGEDYIMSFDKMPEYGLIYYRISRDIMIQQEILKILLPIVQNARIEEKKLTVNIQLVDPPFVPQYKAKPKRLTYMIVISMLVFILELFYFSLMDAFIKNRSEINSWVNKG